MARSKTAKVFRIRCQFCNHYNKNHTKNLDMEYVCHTCGKYAKYRYQQMKKIEVLNSSNGMILDIYQVVEVSKPCTSCGELVSIDFDCSQCMRVKA